MPNKGLRVIGGGVRLELDWPQLATYPDYGLTRTRLDFDELLARTAAGAGAKLLTSHNVTTPVLDQDGRVSGESAYVKYEMCLRRLESDRAGLVGLSGSFFAVPGAALTSWDPSIPRAETLELCE